MKNKSQIRKWAKELRKQIDIKSVSEVLVEKLKQTIEYKSAENIILFFPLENEIDLRELLKDKTKNFYLPKIDGKNLLCCPYNLDCELEESCYKTQEPTTQPCNKNILDLVIIPALACDKNNYRLGYGGGFYDRFLQDLRAKKIVCIPKQFLIDNVCAESHDIKVDMVITD